VVVVDQQEMLAYFALANECENKSFECPLLSDDDEGTLIVETQAAAASRICVAQ
jgi:hypothetical protein